MMLSQLKQFVNGLQIANPMPHRSWATGSASSHRFNAPISKSPKLYKNTSTHSRAELATRTRSIARLPPSMCVCKTQKSSHDSLQVQKQTRFGCKNQAGLQAYLTPMPHKPNPQTRPAYGRPISCRIDSLKPYYGKTVPSMPANETPESHHDQNNFKMPHPMPTQVWKQ